MTNIIGNFRTSYGFSCHVNWTLLYVLKWMINGINFSATGKVKKVKTGFTRRWKIAMKKRTMITRSNMSDVVSKFLCQPFPRGWSRRGMRRRGRRRRRRRRGRRRRRDRKMGNNHFWRLRFLKEGILLRSAFSSWGMNSSRFIRYIDFLYLKALYRDSIVTGRRRRRRRRRTRYKHETTKDVAGHTFLSKAVIDTQPFSILTQLAIHRGRMLTFCDMHC